MIIVEHASVGQGLVTHRQLLRAAIRNRI